MTLEQLRTLSRIVECGSLKVAAQSLHKTQPALSMAIKKLESEYGFQILNRDGYRLSLTVAGKAFYRKAQELLLNADQLSVMGQHLGAGNEPLIRLAYDLSCPHPMVIDSLQRCQQTYPDTDFHVLSESRFGALEILQQDRADLAVTPWWPTFYALGDFDTLTICPFSVVLVAAPGLFGDVPVRSMSQLRSRVNLEIQESKLRVDSEELMLVKGARQWKTRDATTLKQMLIAGLGWGFIPVHLVADELRQGLLVTLELEDMECQIEGEIRLVRKLEHPLGPVGDFFWHNLAEMAQAQAQA